MHGKALNPFSCESISMVSSGSGTVKEFYESNPFPSKNIESKDQLRGNAAWLSALVGKEPNGFFEGERILEAGCGTGEFSCAFAMGGASVLGIDLSKASLEKARNLAKRFNLENTEFLQMDILGNNLSPASFDFVFSMGALHHNKNPRQAFSEIARLVKPSGFIVVGLYNRYGRIPVIFKRILLFLLAGSDCDKRVILANRLFCKNKPLTDARRIWLADKYCHPLEKTVSFSEVLEWFKENNLEFCSSKPKIESFKNLGLLLAQLSWMLKGISFFTVAGKSKGNKKGNNLDQHLFVR